MRVVTSALTGCLLLGMTGLVLANPALLPSHPGYPSRGEFAHDTGRQNLTHAQSLENAAESGNANIVQQLEDPANPKLLREEGAGDLPSAQAPNRETKPPVAKKTQTPK